MLNFKPDDPAFSTERQPLGIRSKPSLLGQHITSIGGHSVMVLSFIANLMPVSVCIKLSSMYQLSWLFFGPQVSNSWIFEVRRPRFYCSGPCNGIQSN